MNPQEFDGLELEEAPKGTRPKCPCCERRLEKIWIKKRGRGLMEQKQIIMCPHCEAFLGYGVFGRK
jgi:hypothetical protein